MKGDKNQISQDSWLLNADEACRVLGGGITRRMIYRWCEQELIPFRRIGRRIFFVRRQLDEWKESNDHCGGES